MKNHEILEKNVGLLAIFMVIAVSIGGLTQIVPLFFQDVTNTPVDEDACLPVAGREQA